jgi:glycosyltransferase involved in cell wall biosynthesis
VNSIACWFGIRLAISRLLFQPVFVLLALRSRLWLGLLNHRTDGRHGEPRKTMKPKVSICVPNLNTRPFLPERFETIFRQSFQDWELLVYDSYSDDGSWEYIQELAAHEKRMCIWQGPRQGTPSSWNPCIRSACGEYVYVATSDDTMALDCLEKLVTALEQHKDCGLAHCPLVLIDETGMPHPEQWWPEWTVFGQSAGELVNQPHVRRAPYDGLLPLTGRSAYFSFTQLLIRRSLFTQIGPLESRWGSIGDVNWYMRAGLVSNTVHVPDTCATLRVHAKSATSAVHFCTPEFYGKIDDMILDAVRACEGYLEPSVVSGLKLHWLDWTRDLRAYDRQCRRLRRNGVRRLLYQMAKLFNCTAARSQIVGRLFGKPGWGEVAPAEIRRWLESLGLGPMIVPAQPQGVDRVDRLAHQVCARAS